MLLRSSFYRDHYNLVEGRHVSYSYRLKLVLSPISGSIPLQYIAHTMDRIMNLQINISSMLAGFFS